eukprot:2888404-Heterocapsa_arctica.AAC.1
MGGPLEPPHVQHICILVSGTGLGLAVRYTSTLATSPQDRSNARSCCLVLYIRGLVSRPRCSDT